LWELVSQPLWVHYLLLTRGRFRSLCIFIHQCHCSLPGC
jgi:hypothetical protein